MARLPEPAKLEWKEDGTPVATSFDDVYFSLSDGLEETRAVFLKACGLPEGWQCVPSYTIAELGFGTGLNFLATVEAWLKSTTGQNNWLHFTSVEKHPMSPQDAARALALFQELRAADQDADDPEVAGFDLVRQDAPEGSALWIHDDDHGDVEAVIRFVLRLADELDLIGLWGFQYALTCSRPRLDAFGGGAHVIDLGARKSIGWISTQEWLAAALNGEDVDA